MDCEQVQNRVQMQIGFWRAVGKLDWVQASKECLWRSERWPKGIVAGK